MHYTIRIQRVLPDYSYSSTTDLSDDFHQNGGQKMQRLTLPLFLSGLLLTAAFPQHQSSRDRRDLQILTPLIDQSITQDPPFSGPYLSAADHYEHPSNFPPLSFFPAPDTTFAKNNHPTILNPEPSIETTYCTEKKVLVCCPEQNSEKYKIPDDGYLASDCRLAAQYGVEFGKYPCRCCGGFFGGVRGLGEPPLGSSCVDITNDAEGTGETNDGRGENEGEWY